MAPAAEFVLDPIPIQYTPGRRKVFQGMSMTFGPVNAVFDWVDSWMEFVVAFVSFNVEAAALLVLIG